MKEKIQDYGHASAWIFDENETLKKHLTEYSHAVKIIDYVLPKDNLYFSVPKDAKANFNSHFVRLGMRISDIILEHVKDEPLKESNKEIIKKVVQLLRKTIDGKKTYMAIGGNNPDIMCWDATRVNARIAFIYTCYYDLDRFLLGENGEDQFNEVTFIYPFYLEDTSKVI